MLGHGLSYHIIFSSCGNNCVQNDYQCHAFKRPTLLSQHALHTSRPRRCHTPHPQAVRAAFVVAVVVVLLLLEPCCSCSSFGPGGQQSQLCPISLFAQACRRLSVVCYRVIGSSLVPQPPSTVSCAGAPGARSPWGFRANRRKRVTFAGACAFGTVVDQCACRSC